MRCYMKLFFIIKSKNRVTKTNTAIGKHIHIVLLLAKCYITRNYERNKMYTFGSDYNKNIVIRKVHENGTLFWLDIHIIDILMCGIRPSESIINRLIAKFWQQRTVKNLPCAGRQYRYMDENIKCVQESMQEISKSRKCKIVDYQENRYIF